MGSPPPIGQIAKATGEAEADFDAAPFYIALGERISLEADPTEFVVETEEPFTSQAVRQLLLERGLQSSQSKALLVEPRHWLVTISPRKGTSPRSVATTLRSDPRVRFAEPVYRTGVLRSKIRPVNRLVVRFKTTILPADALNRFLEDHRLEVEAAPVPERGIYPYWFRFLPRVETRALEVAARLHGDPSVLWAEVDAVVDGLISAAPPDPYYSLQYYLRNNVDSHNGVPVDINVEAVWPVTTGQGIKVGVFDSGVDVLHPDLQLAGWQSYDAVNDTTPEARPCLGDAWHPIVSAADTVNNGHGTAVAGIIAAKHNSIGISGVSPSVTMHIARILCENVDGVRIWATPAKVANAFSYAAVYWGTDVINSSWSYPSTSQAIADAMNVALTQGRNGRGTVLVFASGNYSGYPPPFPSYLANVIAVGAITRTGARAAYSQGQESLDLVAPSAAGTNFNAFWGIAPADVVTLDLAGSMGINDGPGGNQDYT